MRYIRTFRLQASHFNSERAYHFVWGWDQAMVRMMDKEEVFGCLKSIHGHNFKIVVALESELAGRDWIVDDVDLEKIVMEWDNQNLSMHRDFFAPRIRATTEQMADVLLVKLGKRFGNVVRYVEVWENNSIMAEVGTRRSERETQS